MQACLRVALTRIGPYRQALRDSWVWSELHAARNIRPGTKRALRKRLPRAALTHHLRLRCAGFRAGLWAGLAHAALDTYLLRGAAPWTLRHGAPDHAALAPAAASERIAYPPPDGTLTFDVLTSLARSGTNHGHDQPPHLKVRDASVAEAVNRDVFDGPEGRYCPAGVYEWVPPAEGSPPKLVVNAQNCLHCVRARCARCAALRCVCAV